MLPQRKRNARLACRRSGFPVPMLRHCPCPGPLPNSLTRSGPLLHLTVAARFSDTQGHHDTRGDHGESMRM